METVKERGQTELGCEEKGANLDFWLGPLGRLRFRGRGVAGKRGNWKPGRLGRKGCFKLTHVKEIQIGVEIHISQCCVVNPHGGIL